MNIVNTTKIPTFVLKRVIAWCAREIAFDTKRVREAKFRNRTYGHSGRAWDTMRFMVAVQRPDGANYDIRVDTDWVAVVEITAHELQHLKQFTDGSDDRLRAERDMESHTRRIGKSVAERFAPREAELIAEWFTPHKRPVRVAATSTRDDPLTKARDMLTTWNRKLALARTKVAKYKRRVKYYEDKASETPPESAPPV